LKPSQIDVVAVVTLDELDSVDDDWPSEDVSQSEDVHLFERSTCTTNQNTTSPVVRYASPLNRHTHTRC